jgi:hypothetical protein
MLATVCGKRDMRRYVLSATMKEILNKLIYSSKSKTLLGDNFEGKFHALFGIPNLVTNSKKALLIS